MPHHLQRQHGRGDHHFITFSCHGRNPYLETPASKSLFLRTLEQTRARYRFTLCGYVIMPEHIHLLLSEPEQKPLASAIAALKLSVSKQSRHHPFWLPRYYDANILSYDVAVQVLRYIHRNPVKRGLVAHPDDWPWSSFRHYYLHDPSPIQITPPSAHLR
jgi:putative transposase